MGRRRILLVLLVSTAAAAAVLASVIVAHASARPAGSQALPKLQVTYPPSKLKPGTWRTGDGFVPLTTFKVGPGWYGNHRDTSNWGIGIAYDPVIDTYAGGAILMAPPADVAPESSVDLQGVEDTVGRLAYEGSHRRVLGRDVQRQDAG